MEFWQYILLGVGFLLLLRWIHVYVLRAKEGAVETHNNKPYTFLLLLGISIFLLLLYTHQNNRHYHFTSNGLFFLILAYVSSITLIAWSAYKVATHYELDTGDPADQAEELHKRTSIYQNPIAARRETEHSLARTEVVTQIATEITARTYLAEVKEDARLLPERLERKIEAERVQHKLDMAIKFMQLYLTKKAVQHNLTPEAFVEVQKAKALNEAGVDHESQLALAEIRANFVVKHFRDHQQLAMIQNQLDTLYEEIEVLTRDKPLGWKNKIADRNKSIKTLRGNKDGIQQRLLPAYQQEEMEGLDQDTEVQRDPR